jgi:hypothetical protein
MPDENSQQARVLPETDLPASTSKLTSNDPCPVPSVSREPCLMCDPTYPQAISVVSYPKTSSASSGSQEQPNSDAMPPNPSGQPSLALLASFGIKVRDFAYESTLPPIASIPRVPRQVLPGPRPLKRARKDYDGSEDEPSPQPPRSQGGRSVSDSRYTDAPRKSRPLERKSTEPASDPSIALSARARAYTDLSGYDPLENMTLPLRTLSIQVSTLPPPSQLNDPPDQPSSPSGSQETEPYIHTPSVTPNGSLQWALPSCPPNDDELPVPDDSSPSPRIDPPPSSPLRIASSSPLKSQMSMLLSPPSIGLLKSTPTPPIAQRTLQTHQLDAENNRPEASSTEPSTTTSPRYVLRKRPAASPQASPRPPSRARPSRTAALRQPHFTMQAAHSASKTSIGGSPRTRTLRKNGKEGSATHSS